MKTLSLLPVTCLTGTALLLELHSIPVSAASEQRPVLSIAATQNIAEEDSVPFDRLALTGLFTISRTGPTNDSLPVYVLYSGTATSGEDYPHLPWLVSIPAGSTSATIRVEAIADSVREGLETVVATLSKCPPPWSLAPCVDVEIDPARERATVFIRDDGLTRASVTITSPKDGATFNAGETIVIEAVAIDLDGYINRVEFWDGDQRIGVSEIVFIRPPDPGTPIHHRFEWQGAGPGPHVLTARAAVSGATVLTSPPVRITVGPEPPQPVVSIEATRRIAEESSAPYRRMNFIGEFTISRSGPTNAPLPVYVQYSGSATPGEDYPQLPFLVSIPAGSTSAVIRVAAIPDQMPEGIETLVATISDCPPPGSLAPCYDFKADPARESATVFLRDDGVTQASLAITSPKDGANFNVGDSILIEAIAIDLEGYISRVEFRDGDQQIGVSEIIFIRAPDPGTPIHHSFEWQGAGPGAHVLTARAQGAENAVLISPPVHITVGPIVDRVVLDIVATDAEAAEVGEQGAPDPAVFAIRRVAGPKNLEVLVFYSLAGTAQNGIDYEELSGRVLLPNGAESVRVVVTPIQDRAIEGEESVVARLEPPICVAIFPPPPQCYEIGARGEARAVIRDGAPNELPTVSITRPANGAEFPANTPIEIVAETRDPDGYARRMEFFADGRKIGEINLEFIRPPEPGQPQRFSFVWRYPMPGPHALTARATDNDGGRAESAPVQIRVAPAEPLPLVTVMAGDPVAVEPTSTSTGNTAAFLLRRFGPTNNALAVSYSLHGTARNGVDYETLSGLASIPAGRKTATVLVRPLPDNLAEKFETVILQLEPAPPGQAGYRLCKPSRAVAVISDRPFPWHSLADARCAPLPDGLRHVCFGAEAGHSFRVEVSSDLRNWETVCHGLTADGAVHFVDDEAGEFPRRFYRIAPQPDGMANDE
jgi:hypothetical protein